MSHLEELDCLREALTGGPDAAALYRQRARAIEAFRLRRTPRRRLAVALAAAVVVVGGAAGVAGALRRPPVPVTFADAQPVPMRAPLVVPGHGAPLVLRFTDASEVTVALRSEVELEAVDAARVEVRLRSGRLDARVTAGTGRTWRYLAGGWAVRVTGTALTVRWAPADEALEVSVAEGAVEVTGPGLASPRLVRAGERFSSLHAEGAGAHAPDASVPAGVDLDVEEEPPAAGDTPAKPASAVRPIPLRHATRLFEDSARAAPPDLAESVEKRSPSSQGPSKPALGGAAVALAPEPPDAERTSSAEVAWSQLLAGGRSAEALAAAREAGVLERPDALGDDDALQLADAARLTRDVALARRLLATVADRTGASSAESAFLLGRLEAEQRRPWAAMAAFRRSLEREARGAWAEQSRGRLLELLRDAGDAAAAARAAEEYLAYHPEGAWAAAAHDTLDGWRRREP